jgi:GT2 family glycosyltransferase
MSGPLVSIVILSWNRPRSTRSTLRALANVPAGVPREVIVVDNGSGVRTGDELMALQRQGLIDRLLLLPENRGTSPGYNAGFRAADPRSSFYTKLDNDIELLTPDWLKELVGLLDASPSVGIASTEIVNHVGIQELPVIHLETGHQVRDWIGCPAGGGGMTFRRALYEDIGGFREHYGEGLLLMPDDLEFFFRVRERNLNAYYVHAVHSRTIDHLEETPASYLAFKKRQYFLLRTRYFDVARTGGSAFVPHLVSVEAFPALIHPGQSISVRCSIAAGDQRSMTLGCTVASTETNSIADCSVTADIQTATPLSVHELSLLIPPTLPPGPYFVKAALWRDSAAADISERLADLMQLSEPIEVAARDSAPGEGRAAALPPRCT